MKGLVFQLLFTAVLLPYVSYNFDQPLTERQWEVLMVLSKIAFAKFVLVFVLNTATNNYSQVDKLWSIMPMLYSWVMVFMSGFNSRILLATGLITLWGSRLTYNFAKKGGYSLKFWEGEEDYRWAHVRKIPFLTNPISWFLFNLFFISLYQSYLIMGFTLPLVLSIGNNNTLGLIDWVAAILFLGFLTLETVADRQ